MNPFIPSPSNVFSAPLIAPQANADQKLERLRKKNVQRGSLYLFVTGVLLIAYGFSFLYPQLSTFLSAPSVIQTSKAQIEELSSTTLPNLTQEKNLKKAAYDKEYQTKQDALALAFPETTDRLGIVKALENFALKKQSTTPPFEFNSISFAEPVLQGGVTILPISTNIHSSTPNFQDFLNYVQLSGRLDATYPFRLMEISSINISYRGTDSKTGEDKGVDFSLKLNAYSRPEPKTASPKTKK